MNLNFSQKFIFSLINVHPLTPGGGAKKWGRGRVGAKKEKGVEKGRREEKGDQK